MADRPELHQPEHRRYFVVITSGLRYWWDRLLAPKKSHCFLLVWDEFMWICMNPTLGITELSVITMPDEVFAHPDVWLDDDDAVVVEAALQWDERARVPWVWSPVTCVEIVKSCLGIRRFWLWTPRQLERYLRDREHGKQ